MTKVLVLDRDGVINAESPDFIKSPEEWRPLPGSVEAIARASQAGYRIAVATNQSGVGRGLFDLATLELIHARMADSVEAAGGRIDLIVYCPHRPEEGCACRKPKPGLLRKIEENFGIVLAGCWAIGDSQRDLTAARAVGAVPVLVRTGNGTRTEQDLGIGPDVKVFDNLAAAVDALISES